MQHSPSVRATRRLTRLSRVLGDARAAEDLDGTVDDPPATYPDVLSVGAVDSHGDVTDFSSRGPAPDGSWWHAMQ